MNSVGRNEYALKIIEKLQEHKDDLHHAFVKQNKGVPFFFIDNLLPTDWCAKINDAFPDTSEMVLKKSLREDKYVGVQMNEYKKCIEEITYAFQDNRVVELVGDICGIRKCYADASLYAGGISSMKEKQFLSPHLDNSHDKDRKKWRVLNLLYYTTPDWELEYGGNLEVWPESLKGKPITIGANFNRLVVMGTDNHSWHSVSPVTVNKRRNCVSNYYFSNAPLTATDSFHVTLFRAWPHQKLSNVALKVDGVLRMAIRKVFPKGIVKNPHVYKKKPSKES